jgi:vitamin B12 transporter
VAEALQAQTPGLYIAANAGPFNYVNVSLQGSRKQDGLWLVDDIRINNRLYAGMTPLDTIPASMIERIEVLDGGQSSHNANVAIGGALPVGAAALARTSRSSASGIWTTSPLAGQCPRGLWRLHSRGHQRSVLPGPGAASTHRYAPRQSVQRCRT